MKANELMIGDWVYYGKKPVKVLQLSEGKDYKEINPIPLTSEILEKNGFVQVGLMYRNPEFHITIRDVFGGDLFLSISVRDVQLKYVHELQHALRLCGIEKEIVL